MTVTNRPRLEKRKQATRLRLMASAYALMAEKGASEVSIQEITSAADVGAGTFYTYFASKEAIYDALVEEVLEASGTVLEAAMHHLADPAERVSAGIQYAMLRAYSDPLWGKFLCSSLMSRASAAKGVGQFFLRDVFEGVAQNRFRVDDLQMSMAAIAGTIHAMVRLELEELRNALGHAGVLRADEIANAKSVLNLVRRTAALALRILGIPPEESRLLVKKPLPPIEELARFFNRESEVTHGAVHGSL